jgi:hypothetical protein
MSLLRLTLNKLQIKVQSITTISHGNMELVSSVSQALVVYYPDCEGGDFENETMEHKSLHSRECASDKAQSRRYEAVCETELRTNSMVVTA